MLEYLPARFVTVRYPVVELLDPDELDPLDEEPILGHKYADADEDPEGVPVPDEDVEVELVVAAKDANPSGKTAPTATIARSATISRLLLLGAKNRPDVEDGVFIGISSLFTTISELDGAAGAIIEFPRTFPNLQ